VNYGEIYDKIIYNLFRSTNAPTGVEGELKGDEGIIAETCRGIAKNYSLWFMQSVADLDIEYGRQRYALPTDYKEMVSLIINIGEEYEEASISVTSGNTTISGLSYTSSYFEGYTVHGTPIPDDTQIISVGSGSIELSHAPTVTGTYTITIREPVFSSPLKQLALGAAQSNFYQSFTREDPSIAYEVYGNELFIYNIPDEARYARLYYYSFLSDLPDEEVAGGWTTFDAYSDNFSEYEPRVIIYGATMELAGIRGDETNEQRYAVKFQNEIETMLKHQMSRQRRRCDRVIYKGV